MSQQTSEQKKTPAYAKWLGFGTEFGGVIAVFCYIGYKVDTALNTSPYFLLAGFFISFIGMLYLVIKQTMDNRRK
ncbi:MAG: AtpZ/AtpI family protein [Sedimentisphaerales bacterium]